MPINSTRGAGSAKGFGFTGKTGLSGDIALFGGQFASPVAIEFVQITTLGNSKDFGDLSTNDMTIGAASNVRGLFCGSNSPTGIQYNNTIDFVNIVKETLKILVMQLLVIIKVLEEIVVQEVFSVLVLMALIHQQQ